MEKIVKAWVETHERADGVKFYTAHIRFRGVFLWFIPYIYTYNVVMMWSKTSEQSAKYDLHSNDSFYDPHRFSTKQEAEDQLMEQIDKTLDRQREDKNSKVVSITKEYLPLCPINDDRGVA